jgi:hypothetical protein
MLKKFGNAEIVKDGIVMRMEHMIAILNGAIHVPPIKAKYNNADIVEQFDPITQCYRNKTNKRRDQWHIADRARRK